MAAIRVQVYGRVQGVGFRYHTRNQAVALHLAGWVKNMHDGSVTVQAQGNAQHLTQLLEWLHQGPPHCRVERGESDWVEAEKDLTGFATY